MENEKFNNLLQDTKSKMNVEFKQSESDSMVKVLEISGEYDPNHPTLLKARELVVASGSPEMLQAFDESMDELKNKLGKAGKPKM